MLRDRGRKPVGSLFELAEQPLEPRQALLSPLLLPVGQLAAGQALLDLGDPVGESLSDLLKVIEPMLGALTDGREVGLYGGLAGSRKRGAGAAGKDSPDGQDDEQRSESHSVLL
jgi:hypothetical protein